ncbi:MAG TPA: DivIVA domain-containing protein [Micromonosporaceae bacterium]|nr:DivIVA domain-containing protein [Micromonosporaceae bacterium]
MNEHLPQRLTAQRIRSTRFAIVRRGYDPQAVHEYLSQLADELLQLNQQLAWSYAENDRIKRHLRQWQTDHAATCRNLQGRRTYSNWPINRS